MLNDALEMLYGWLDEETREAIAAPDTETADRHNELRDRYQQIIWEIEAGGEEF